MIGVVVPLGARVGAEDLTLFVEGPAPLLEDGVAPLVAAMAGGCSGAGEDEARTDLEDPPEQKPKESVRIFALIGAAAQRRAA